MEAPCICLILFDLQPNHSNGAGTDPDALVASAQRLIPDALQDAAATDAVDSFPEQTIAAMHQAGLLTACVRSADGGQDVGLVPGTNATLLRILKYIGGGNLVAGRVLEGHMNAQLLIRQFGTETQQKRFAADAFAGNLFGVWNTQAQDGTVLTPKQKPDFVLNGSKTFATGSGYVSRPIITAALPDGGWQMAVVSLDETTVQTDTRWWQPMGMRSSRSYKITFCDAPLAGDQLLGTPGAYYRQPYFSGGAVRFAAVQLGAAETLLHQTIEYLCALNRTEDPYQRMRLGRMTVAVASGNQWLQGAAAALDQYMQVPTEEGSERLLAFANMMRTAIEQICVDVLGLCQQCVGARGLNQPYAFERIIRDLSTYLRQPAPDESLAAVGRYVLENERTDGTLWEPLKNL
ncbi:MAG: acyl-CoA dehydrogenase [Sphingobacteriales bacterium]|nr:MAG: acyl-CoA dehydrogenase [Sphingobacteriales bacterium]